MTLLLALTACRSVITFPGPRDTAADTAAPDTADTSSADTSSADTAVTDTGDSGTSAAAGLVLILTWDDPSADVDLHLMTAEDAFYRVPDDCNQCNKAPDWGAIGVAEDDPSLDIDDLYGYGPEQISIATPSAGTYFPVVHYYEDNGAAEVHATVETWSDGLLIATATASLSRNEVWQVGAVALPGPTFTPGIDPPVLAAERTCR